MIEDRVRAKMSGNASDGLVGRELVSAMLMADTTGTNYLVPIESEEITLMIEACAPGAYALKIHDDRRGVLVRAPGARFQQYGTCQLLENDEVLVASGGLGDEGWVLIDGPTGAMLLGCVNGGELVGQRIALRATDG
jgi:hypothetical protein